MSKSTSRYVTNPLSNQKETLDEKQTTNIDTHRGVCVCVSFGTTTNTTTKFIPHVRTNFPWHQPQRLEWPPCRVWARDRAYQKSHYTIPTTCTLLLGQRCPKWIFPVVYRPLRVRPFGASVAILHQIRPPKRPID